MTKLQNKSLYDEDLTDVDIDYQTDIVADIDDLADDWTDDLDDWYPEANEFFRQYRSEQNIFDY